MRWIRGLGRFLGAALLVVLLVPALAAWPSAILDRGPDGTVRVSAFPLALTLLDPFAWTCARNSVLVASLTAVGATLIGVGLGWIVESRRFRGRGVLWALVIAPAAAGPLLIAPSLASALGGSRGWEWLASRSALGFSAEGAVRWGALVWTGLAWGVPLVAMATVAGLRRVDPSWIDSALAFGASRRWAWRDVTWPILRPGVARASLGVFTLALVEPAGPIVLGLPRTLAAQMVRAATRLDQPTRAAPLALMAIALALVSRSLIAWWGGPSYARSGGLDAGGPPLAGFRRASASRLILAAWSVVAAGPLGLWLWRALPATQQASAGDFWLALFDPEARVWLANSATTAGLALVVDLVILAALLGRSPGTGGRLARLASRVFEAVPPLALGVGALATPWLVLVVADVFDGPVGRWLQWLSTELSPGRSPGFLLILVLAAGQWPRLAGVAALAKGAIRPARVEASRLMGESDRRASRGGLWPGVVPASAVFLAFALAFTSLAPALLLGPFSERRTLAPGVLGLVEGGGMIDARAVGPIAVWLGVNLLALALRGRAEDRIPSRT